MNTFAKEAEIHRNTIISYVYRISGSLEEAKDITQETLIRYVSLTQNDIKNPRAWLFKVATHLAFDYLRKNKIKKERYIGPWLPEPYLEEKSVEENMEIDESLSMAFFILMDKLSYKERIVYILYEIFEFQHKEIAKIVDITLENSRKLFSRANLKIKNVRKTTQPLFKDYKKLTHLFIQAIQDGNIEELQKILSIDVTVYSDGGGNAIAARKVLYGDNLFISKFLVNVISSLFSRNLENIKIQTLWFNGSLGIILEESKILTTSFHFQIDNQVINTICILRNPEKLKYFLEKVV